MDETKFKSKISGEVRFSDRGYYPYFQPHELPFDIKLSSSTYRMCEEAMMALSRLEGRAMDMTEEERGMFQYAFTLRESVHSSSIEGTVSTLSDMYLYEKGSAGDVMSRDSREVSNYKDAMKLGMDYIDEGNGIDVEILQRMHKVLMNSVRGWGKSPGEFKSEQNAIGRPGDTLETAAMVPAPPESVGRLISNLLEYIEFDENPVVKIAIAHYQFEVIHPYRDGNGRLGRLLIMLILHKEGILTHPMIYPSGYFDKCRDEYIDALFAVSSEDRFDEWVRFFALAMKEQVDDSMATIDRLRAYRTELIGKFGKNESTRAAIELMFSNPYISTSDLSSSIGVSQPTASKVLKKLENEGIVREVTGKSRNRLYLAEGVLDILSGKWRS